MNEKYSSLSKKIDDVLESHLHEFLDFPNSTIYHINEEISDIIRDELVSTRDILYSEYHQRITIREEIANDTDLLFRILPFLPLAITELPGIGEFELVSDANRIFGKLTYNGNAEGTDISRGRVAVGYATKLSLTEGG